MEVPEEDSAQLAKRKAIQEVMRDRTLSAQERQKKMQEIFAIAAKAASAPPPRVQPMKGRPATTTHPSPNFPEPTGAVKPAPSPSRKSDDHNHAQKPPPPAAFSQDNLAEEPPASAAPALSGAAAKGPRVAAPKSSVIVRRQAPSFHSGSISTVSSGSVQRGSTVTQNSSSVARQSMMAIMRDSTLTDQEKQRKIQRVMAESSATDHTENTTGDADLASTNGDQSKGDEQQAPVKRASVTPRAARKIIGSRTPGAVGVAGPAGPSSRNSAHLMTDEEIKRSAEAWRNPPGATVDEGSIRESVPDLPPQPSGTQQMMMDRDSAIKAGARGLSAQPVSPGAQPYQPQEHQEKQTMANQRMTDKLRRDEEARRTPGATRSVASMPSKRQPRPSPASVTGRQNTDTAQIKQTSLDQRASSSPTVTGAVHAVQSHDGLGATKMGTSQTPSGATPSHEQIIKGMMLGSPQAMQQGKGPPSSPMHVPQNGVPAYASMPQSNADPRDGTDIAHSKQAAPVRNAAIEMQQLEREIVGKSADVQTTHRSSLSEQTQQNMSAAAQFSHDRNSNVSEGPLVANPAVDAEHNGAAVDLTDVVDGGQDGGFKAFVADVAVEAMGVAVIMSEQESEALIERKRKQLLCRIGTGVCCCATIIVIILVVVFTKGDDDPAPAVRVAPTEMPSMVPSASPTSQGFASIVGALEGLYDDPALYEEAFGSMDTPQYVAAEWVAGEGSMDLAANDPRTISRYALTTLYFATGGDSWFTCSRGSTTCALGEWLQGDECEWYGITCEDGAVTRIILPGGNSEGNNLVGSLPYEMALFSKLDILTISGNLNLVGSIPESWFPRLNTLTTVLLTSNSLTGLFPSLLMVANKQLKTLSLFGNLLEGSLSGLGAGSPELESLELSNNAFTGTIPDSILNLPALKSLDLDRNNLRGSIPEELYALSELRFVRLDYNPLLGGSLSEEVTGWPELEDLRLRSTMVGGKLPLGLFNATNLRFLLLDNAAFTGTIPDAISQLTNLREARLNNNSFTGSLPSTLELLTPVNQTVLNRLLLHSNELVGIVPQAVCEAKGNNRLNLQYLTADCSGESPLVNCSCCDECF